MGSLPVVASWLLPPLLAAVLDAAAVGLDVVPEQLGLVAAVEPVVEPDAAAAAAAAEPLLPLVLRAFLVFAVTGLAFEVVVQPDPGRLVGSQLVALQVVALHAAAVAAAVDVVVVVVVVAGAAGAAVVEPAVVVVADGV